MGLGNNDNRDGNNDHARAMRVKIVAAIAISAVAVAAISMVMIFWPPASTEEDRNKAVADLTPSANFSSMNRVSRPMFEMSICDEGADPSGELAAGDGANPKVIERRVNSSAVITFCTRSTDTSEGIWYFDTHGVTGEMRQMLADGRINVTFDREFIRIAEYTGLMEDFSAGKGNTDEFDVIITVDDKVEPGVYYFRVDAKKQVDEGGHVFDVIGKAVYFEVKD